MHGILNNSSGSAALSLTYKKNDNQYFFGITTKGTSKIKFTGLCFDLVGHHSTSGPEAVSCHGLLYGNLKTEMSLFCPLGGR